MLIWFAVLAFSVFSSMAALRLLLLWRRTRQLPELLIAMLIFGVGTIAVGGNFLVSRLVTPGTPLDALRFLPSFGAGVGMLALCVFTWRVYRAGSAIACSVACAFALGIGGVFGTAVYSGSIDILSHPPYREFNYAMYVGVMLWSSGEAFVYWGPMRRRLKLQLVDPVVVNRVLLWGLATGCAGLGIAIGACGAIMQAPGELPPTWVSATFALFGSVSAIGFWLTFKPPVAYARWIERRGAAFASS